jgi:outer membrane protein
MSLTRCCYAALLTTLLFALPALATAQAEDHWIFKVGAHNVDPQSDNGRLADGSLAVNVGGSVRPTVTLEYLLAPSLGVELLASWPFEHEVKLNGADAAETKQLPPTLTLQYHFAPQAAISPFLGAGLNFTRFFNVEERGPLTGTDLTLGNSWGVAVHGGLDFKLGERWLAGVDLRWIRIASQARVNGVDVGTVNVNPLVYGAYAGYRF